MIFARGFLSCCGFQFGEGAALQAHLSEDSVLLLDQVVRRIKFGDLNGLSVGDERSEYKYDGKPGLCRGR